MSEKFTNYYIETLTATLHDALGKNIVFQAQSRVDSETIADLQKIVEQKQNESANINSDHSRLQSMIESLNVEIERLNRSNIDLQNAVSQKQNEIAQNQNIITDLQNRLNQKEKEVQGVQKQINDANSTIENKHKEISKLKDKSVKQKVETKPKESLTKPETKEVKDSFINTSNLDTF